MFLIAGLVLSAVAGYMQYSEAQSTAKDQRRIYEEQQEQQELSRRVSDVKAARERQNIIRQERIKRAQIISNAEAVGGAGGSAVAGGTGSLRTRTASELGFNQFTQSAGSEIFKSNQEIGRLQTNIAGSQANSALWGAIGQGGSGVFQAGGGWKAVGEMIS